MAKIGTAHIEIKPVLNEDALDIIVQQIEDAVAAGVARGIANAQEAQTTVINVYSPPDADPGLLAQQVAKAVQDRDINSREGTAT